MKRIALILLLAFCACSLFSCGEAADAAIFAAEEKMKSTRNKMSVEYKFSSDNKEVVAILNSEMPTVETVVDGENSASYIKYPDAYEVGAFIEVETIIVGNKVYTSSGGSKTVTTYDAEDIAWKNAENLESRVNISELYRLAERPRASRDGEKIIITFDSLKEGGSLSEFTPALDGLLKSSVLKSFKGEIVINGGTYEKAELSFDITVSGITVTNYMIIKVDTDLSAVTPPADADEYIDIPQDVFIPELS